MSSAFSSLDASRRVARVLLCLACLAPLHAPPGLAQATPAPPAAPVPANPFEAIVPVSDESEASRQKALREALIQVLKRVVGRSDAATTSILSRAPVLVQHYQFQRDAQAGTSMFRAVFDPEAVQSALRAQGLPVFGVNPEVVEGWSVRVSGVDSASDYARVLRHFGGIRGVRRVDAEALHASQLHLRLVVEGGASRIADLALSGGLLRADGDGGYVLVR